MANYEYGILSEPSNYDLAKGLNYEMGWNFTTAKEFYFYGFRIKSPKSIEKVCTLWDYSRNAIATATLTTIVGEWVEVLLDEPILLESGKEYTISTWTDASYYYKSNATSNFAFNTEYLTFKNGKAGYTKGAYPNKFTESYIYPMIDCLISNDLPNVNRYLVRNESTLYTVVDGALSEVAGELSAELFMTHGIDTIPDGSLLVPLSAPEVLCWTDADKVPYITATVQGTPIGTHDIISDDIPIGHYSIYGITGVEAVASEGATFLLSFDGGAYMVYDTDSNSWAASDVGMTATDLVAIPAEAWTIVTNSHAYMNLKVTIDGTGTVTQVKFNFDNDAQ